jgi:glycosyltransferase involved in cell wall biosynthesis
MPVFNGESYVRRALDTILAQTYIDFCLIILDNASTDGTANIVRRYARIDSRVHYRRNETNLGATANFNRVFDFSDSKYFKWAAHDDELAPTYLEKCVQALEADSTAVLAHSYVREIDRNGCPMYTYRPIPEEIESSDRLSRFQASVLHRSRCTELCGLLRADALRGTAKIESFAGSDLSLIIELSLRGRFIIVPEPLFLHRTHAASYTSAIFDTSQDGIGRERVLNWIDSSARKTYRRMHWWIFFVSLFRAINRNIDGPLQRARYYEIAIRWLTVRRNFYDLVKDSLAALHPMLLRGAVQFKRRFGVKVINGPRESNRRAGSDAKGGLESV